MKAYEEVAANPSVTPLFFSFLFFSFNEKFDRLKTGKLSTVEFVHKQVKK